MSKNVISDIIQGANLLLEKQLLKIAPKTVKFYGLSEIYTYDPERKITAPMVNNNGELEYILNLDKSVIGYHRLISSTQRISDQSYGSRPALDTSLNLSMFLIGKRIEVSVRPETLGLYIMDQLTGNDFKGHSARKVDLIPDSFSVDPMAIFKSEFQNVDIKYNSPDYMLIKINYTLKMTYTKGCFNFCNT